MNKKNILLSVAALLGIGLTISSCSNEENPTITSTTTRLTTTLTGAGEKPTSTTSAATGTFAGNLNTTTRVLSYTVTYQGLTPTGGHLHRITNADGTGPVDIPFTSLTSPIIATTAALRQGQVDSLVAGQYYANLHTTTYKGGEIRGEVKKQ
jgi:ABC-type xylose transport system permease subunit